METDGELKKKREKMGVVDMQHERRADDKETLVFFSFLFM
jgi:hypothetical protein